MVNLGNPELAFHTAMLPSGGVGLARMDSSSASISASPMALACPTRSPRSGAPSLGSRELCPPHRFLCRKLSEGVRGSLRPSILPVILRLSDFKTNEYARLIGGAGFEPKKITRCWASVAFAMPTAYAAGFAQDAPLWPGFATIWD